MSPVAVDRRPTRPASMAALLAASVTVLVGARVGAVPTFVGAVGVLGVAGGIVSGSRTWAAGGTGALVLAGLAASVLGGSFAPTMLAAVGAIMAWDLAEFAIGLGEHVGRGARTRRVEAVRIGTSLATGAVALGVVVVLRAIARPLPVAALLVLLVGVLLLAAAIRA